MKKRLDQLLVEQGFTTGRDRAKSLIMAGQVYVNGQKADKAGDEYKDSDAIEVRGEKLRYVSRGGLKLEKALTVFPISLSGKTCCDFGASTGGFTDCMLQNLPVARQFLKESGELVALIKPQFEAGREKVGKKGVVRDPKVHAEVICKVLDCVQGLNFSVKGISFSPVKGPEGNIEYLLYAQKVGKPAALTGQDDGAIEKLVEEAHRALSENKE